MNVPTPAKNYPISPPPSISMAVNIINEKFYTHKVHHEISAHFYELVMGLGCLQLGTFMEETDVLLMPAIFELSKGYSINTERFGKINFPNDFSLHGDI